MQVKIDKWEVLTMDIFEEVQGLYSHDVKRHALPLRNAAALDLFGLRCESVKWVVVVDEYQQPVWEGSGGAFWRGMNSHHDYTLECVGDALEYAWREEIFNATELVVIVGGRF